MTWNKTNNFLAFINLITAIAGAHILRCEAPWCQWYQCLISLIVFHMTGLVPTGRHCTVLELTSQPCLDCVRTQSLLPVLTTITILFASHRTNYTSRESQVVKINSSGNGVMVSGREIIT